MSLKLPWNTFATSLKHHLNLFDRTPLKHHSIFLKQTWNFIAWNILETSLDPSLNSVETPQTKKEKGTNEEMNEQTEWQHHILRCSLQLISVWKHLIVTYCWCSQLWTKQICFWFPTFLFCWKQGTLIVQIWLTSFQQLGLYWAWHRTWKKYQ